MLWEGIHFKGKGRGKRGTEFWWARKGKRKVNRVKGRGNLRGEDIKGKKGEKFDEKRKGERMG